MTESNILTPSLESFLELYVTLSRTLYTRKGKTYPILKQTYMNARKLQGDALQRAAVDWESQTKAFAVDIEASDDTFILDVNLMPACFGDLCLGSILSEPAFTPTSKQNLWKYIQGLSLHAASYVQSCSGDDIPEPCLSSSGKVDEGQLPDLDACKDLANALPENVMKKMHKLAQGYQDDMHNGKKEVSDLNFSNVLRDVVASLDSEDIMSVVGNFGNVMDHMNKSQSLPEIQELMKSMNISK
jgi:hypothetical protein